MPYNKVRIRDLDLTSSDLGLSGTRSRRPVRIRPDLVDTLAQAFANLSSRYVLPPPRSMCRRLAISVAAQRLVSRALQKRAMRKFLADRRQGPGQRRVEWVLPAILALKLWIWFWRNCLPLSWRRSDIFKLFFHLSTAAFTYSPQDAFLNAISLQYSHPEVRHWYDFNELPSRQRTYSAGNFLGSSWSPCLLCHRTGLSPDSRHFSNSSSSLSHVNVGTSTGK